MPKRSSDFRYDMVLLAALAAAIRLLAAWPQRQPSYLDATYSYVNALNLAAGRGFVEDFIWNYLDNPGLPPRPSHLYWMPLTSIIAWLGMLLGGANYRAAQFPFVLLSILFVLITYWVTNTLSGQPWLSWLAGLLAIFSGFYFPFWTAIDNFTPFGIAGALALVAAWKGAVEQGSRGAGEQGREKEQNPKSKIDSRWLFLSGVFVGLAHLARADGGLLLLAIGLGLAWFRVQSSGFGVNPSTWLRMHPSTWLRMNSEPGTLNPEPGTRGNWRARFLRFTFYVLCFMVPLLLGYLVVMLPWFIRNWQVVGTPLPAGGSKTIWLAHFNDLFSYGQEISARTFWAQGVDAILEGRWWVFVINFQTVIAAWGMFLLVPLVLIGGWHLRRNLLVQLSGWYSLLLILVMTLIFAFPGAWGSLMHSGAALLPFIYALAAVGLDRGVDWVAVHRRHWKAPVAKRVFAIQLVALAIGLSGFVYYQQVLRNDAWNQANAFYPAIAKWLREQDPAAIVMIGSPPAYRYHGGGLSVALPNEDVETTLKAARQYGVDYLVLEPQHLEPLAELYRNPNLHPALSLAQTYGQGSGNEVYVFEIKE